MVNKLGENLRILRKIHDKKQEDLAELLALTRSTYASYENRRIEPSISSLIMIADYYGVSIDSLVGRTPLYQNAKEVEPSVQFEEETSRASA